MHRIVHREPTAVDVHRRSRADQLGDALFTGLRLSAGIDEAGIEARYGVDVWHRYGSDLERYVECGLLMRQDRRMWLTRRGMLLANEVMAVFI